ncbi:MAG TPA: DUF6159 family protein [Planctomycetaceae bacterium]|nr:DUF6159 family protein [Planctomycetaceae bacterium]
MFERLSNGWDLAKQSWRVLMLDKELLLFPLFSGIACLLVLASFAVPLWSTGYAETVMNEEAPAQDVLSWVLLFCFYAVNYFVIVFFNSALVSCAIIRFRGGDPTVSDGFRAAGKRLPVILGWALLSATVGVILKAIESRSEKAGQIISSLLGLGWSIATYFVVPVLVVENVGPVDAVKRSWAVIKKTWGESIGANFGIGFITFFCALACFVPIVGGGYLISQGLAGAGAAAILLGFVGLMLVSLVSSALNSIILAALYLYAADHEVPEQFDDRMLRGAFATK